MMFAIRRSALVAARVSPRRFSTGPLALTEKVYEDIVTKSVKEYEASRKDVAAALDTELAKNKMVLFMEGTPDHPKSKQSMNVIKMLTEAQAVPFLAVDVLTHPAIMGYTMAKSNGRRGPHLYVN